MPTRRTWIRQQNKPALAQHPTSATPPARAQRQTTSTSREPLMRVLDRPTQPVFRHRSAIHQDQLLRVEERTAACRRLSSKTPMHPHLRRRRKLRRWDRSLSILLISRGIPEDCNDDGNIFISPLTCARFCHLTLSPRKLLAQNSL